MVAPYAAIKDPEQDFSTTDLIPVTNPLERLNKEVKRRADVVGIFPNEDSITRLIGAVLLEANDEWQLQPRYMKVEGMAELAAPETDEMPQLQITPKAACPMPPRGVPQNYTSLTDATTSDRGQVAQAIPAPPPFRKPSPRNCRSSSRTSDYF